MPNAYPMPGQFMPSVPTLKSWLRTRKSKSQNLPGIFATEDYSSDTTWAMFSILVEIAALVFTIWGAWSLYLKNHSMLILTSAIIIVFLFIAFDILGIMLHGQDKPHKVELRNRIAISHDLIQKEVLYKELNQITWREFMGFMMLIISSILKILAISVFFSKSGVPLLVILVMFYLVVIYIHGFHTGYWWAELTLNNKIKKEYQNFLDCHTRGVESQYSVKNNHQVTFESSVPMGNFNTANHGRQTIKFIEKQNNNNGAVLFRYELTSTGLLFDQDIVSMIAAYGPIFQAALVEASIRLQFNQLGWVHIQAKDYEAETIITDTDNN